MRAFLSKFAAWHSLFVVSGIRTGDWLLRLLLLVVFLILSSLLVIRLWSLVLPAPSVDLLEIRQPPATYQDLSARLYFGSPAQAAAAESKAYQLLGVMAGKPGLAVFRLGSGESRAVREGDDIEPGVRLDVVTTDEVVLERQGVRSTIRLPKK